MKKNRKAMTMNVIVMMVVALVVLAMMIYLANKYILGTGKSAGELAGCKAQHPDADCKEKCGANEQGFYKVGCPPKGEPDKVYCCIPKDI
jgi:hypothetical protein